MNNSPTIYINPDAEGRITPHALLHSEGTIELIMDKRLFRTDYCLFHVATAGFWFGMGFKYGKFHIQRNENLLSIGPSFLKKLKSNDVILASWTLDTMTFLLGPVGFQGPSVTKSLKMKPNPTPLSLFIWARKQSLLPAEQFESESEFLSRIHSGLDLLQDKIDEMTNINAFWDIQYEGNRIIGRTPKKEVDLHSVIQALLSDHMFLSSVEVYSEYQTGVGNLDFLFTGVVKDKGIAKLCAEFKSAHSADLVKGLEYQLPTYMRNKKVEHGTYCILDFRGEWFDKPRIDDQMLTAELGRASSRANLPAVHPVKVHFFRLGKEDSASKL